MTSLKILCVYITVLTFTINHALKSENLSNQRDLFARTQQQISATVPFPPPGTLLGLVASGIFN